MSLGALMVACGRIDPIYECFDQVYQNAILDAAKKIAINGMSDMDGFPVSPEHSTRIDDCKNVGLRWLANELDASSANSVLRGLTNCNLNKG